MFNKDYILFDWSGSRISNYQELFSAVNDKLEFLSKKTTKSIIFCLIELVQNAEKYSLSDFNIRLLKHTDSLILEISNITDNKDADKLLSRYNYLINLDYEEIKYEYRNNILVKENKSSNSVGNGIITCLLKSDKQMQVLINNIKSNQKQVIIKVFFKYEKNNRR